VGIALVLILSGAVAFGVYLWMNPEARSNFVERLDQGWGATKESGDKVMNDVKQVSGGLPPAPSAPAPVVPIVPATPEPPPTPEVPAMPRAN